MMSECGCDKCLYLAINKTFKFGTMKIHLCFIFPIPLTGEKPFKYNFCGSSIVIIPHPEDHEMKHAGEKPNKCIC